MPKNKMPFWHLREQVTIALQGGKKLDLNFLLQDAAALRTSHDRVIWLERLLLWLRLSGGADTTRLTSLKFMLSRLEQNPEWKEHSAKAIRLILLEGRFARLFIDTGVPSSYEFFREGVARLVRRIFPANGDPADMEMVINKVFHDEDDADWIENLPDEIRTQVEQWIFADPTFMLALKEQLIGECLEASTMLCVRVSAISIQRELMDRAGKIRAMEVPPLRLRLHLEDFFAELLAGKTREAVNDSHMLVLKEIASSRRYLDEVHTHLEQHGVSVGIVFSLESASAILNRLETLVQLSLSLRFSEETFAPWNLFVNLLRDNWSEKQITPLLKSNFHLLSRKIVEKSSATGEDYITSNKSEYQAMFWAAMGGGFITAFTGLAKFLGPSDSAPFVMGLYAALNYSFSFILMHHLHFKLATKQPAMTAAVLAERLGAVAGANKLGDFVDLVARISRSQFAAVAGNILAVIPTAFALDFLMRQWTGEPIIDRGYARAALSSFHPFTTLTVFYAALTGGLLWASGLVSGWLQNSFVYYRVTKALTGHPFLQNLLGQSRLEGLVNKIPGNLSGWTSSIALGVMLAFVPVAGSFFGLPLDVRHVTLTTGAVSYSISSLGWANIPGSMLALTALGVLLIGVMNFGVSFALALHIAVRANNIPSNRVHPILRACFGELLKRPLRFFVYVR